jgi:uncharacterized DUF497 family protein
MPRFLWDETKARANKAKHGISFETATLVWEDPLHLLRYDRVEGGDERWHVVGSAAGLVLLLVVHTYPRGDDEFIRVVSARRATRAERGSYEDQAF